MIQVLSLLAFLFVAYVMVGYSMFHIACNGEKELVLVKDAGHGTSFLFEPEKVKAALFSLFSRNNPNDTGEIK